MQGGQFKMLISDKLVSWVCMMQVAFNWMELPRLTEEELDLCRKAFQHFDKDGAECSAKQTVSMYWSRQAARC
jgi:hypothetical protein